MRLFTPAWVLLLVASGCDRAEPTGATGPALSGRAPTTGTKPRPPSVAPLADERIEIPAGAFFAGSIPGERGRDPELEPRYYRVELGAFRIDRLPYPNDPAQAPVTGVTRQEANRLCAARGARLCTELEWERACKGQGSDTYSGGDVWDTHCATRPHTCASGFDVLAMGTLREWVMNDIMAGAEEARRLAVVRGAAAAAPAEDHRCARRRGTEPDSKSDDLGFRCCKGAPNAAIVAEPKLGPAFVKTQLTASRLEQLLRADEHTSALAREVKFFREPDAANTVVSRGPGDRKGFSFTVAPLYWNPVAGSEFLLVAARSGEKTSFVVAYYVLGDDRYALASSFIMHDEAGPVALAYSDSIRPRLHFSTCWGCPGETGKILHRAPDRAVIVQP